MFIYWVYTNDTLAHNFFALTCIRIDLCTMDFLSLNVL